MQTRHVEKTGWDVSALSFGCMRFKDADSAVGAAVADIRNRVAAGEEGWVPSACTACGECEAKCPNRIPISELMASATEGWPSP